MLLSRRARALVKTIDVCIKSLSIDPPDPASSDLDGRQLTRPNKRVDLRHADIEIGRYILVLLLSSALIVSIWGVARERLVSIVSGALSTVCGNIGC